MKTRHSALRRPLRSLFILVATCTFLPGIPARAEIFVSALNGTKVSSYDTLSGAVRNLDFVSGLTGVVGVTVAGNQLYVVKSGGVARFDAITGAVTDTILVPGMAFFQTAVSGSDLYTVNVGAFVGKYTTAGATQNATLIIETGRTYFLAVSGTRVYVCNDFTDTVGLYTTAGDVVNTSFISGLNGPGGIVIDDGKLYLVNSNEGEIRVYDAATGALINGAFITGLNNPTQIAIYKNRLYVGNSGTGTVAVYDATTGAVIDASFITGAGNISGLAIRPVLTPTVRIKGRKTIQVKRPTYTMKGSGTELGTVRVKVGRKKYKSAKVTSGSWSFRARLEPGRNRVSVLATNSEGVNSRLAKAKLVRSGG